MARALDAARRRRGRPSRPIPPPPPGACHTERAGCRAHRRLGPAACCFVIARGLPCVSCTCGRLAPLGARTSPR
ncbi:hypothetical protein U9M48_011073 [Paspalum notatum var. saurae]|uniref:Uncharacterized protein n=1 Tax=Paspalum notatum var. saurae TaxID=547442 RepID=A0AAQ3SUJ8_PASNO